MRYRIGIITYPHIESGKGRFLQAYALYSAIAGLGYEPTIIDYIPQRPQKTKAQIIKGLIKEPSKISSYQYALKSKLYMRLYQEHIGKDIAAYDQFIGKRMQIVPQQNADSLEILNDKFDAFICGSDQIWNPNFLCGRDPVYYLQFAHREKRISYAASMGTTNITQKQLSLIEHWIRDIPYCSLREKTSCEYLMRHLSLPCYQICDPTFLMPRKWWAEFASAPKSKEPYLLAFLFDNNRAPRQYVKAIAKKNGWKIVCIPQTVDDFLEIGTEKIFTYGPQEFVSLFKNAEFICTQSFHGTVLSLIYNKPFAVFDRAELGQVEGLSLRITDLLKTFGLNDRLISTGRQFELTDIDYAKVNQIMEKERQRGLAYLQGSINSVLGA